MDLICSSILRYNELLGQTYYLTLSCNTCTKEILERELFSCMVSLLLSSHFAIVLSEHSSDCDCDLATVAALRLSEDIFLLSQEVKELDMILVLRQSPKHLEQL